MLDHARRAGLPARRSLADAAELAEPGTLVVAVGADERGVKRADDLLELRCGEAFVGR